MSLCSCFPSCSCSMQAGNDLINIVGNGDPLDGGWTISGVETVFSPTNDDGGIEITPNGAYGHEPRFNLVTSDTATIALGVTPMGGLEANLISVPSGGGGVPTGAFFPWLTDVAPAGYGMLTGPNALGLVDIADYSALFTVIGHSLNGGVDPGGAQFMVALPDNHFLSTNPAGGDVGDTGGLASVVLDVTEIPSHGHLVTIDGSTTGITTASGGNHSHDGAGANHDFVVENSSPASFEYLAITATNADTAGTMRFSSNGVEGGLSKKPNREQFTAQAGSHTHGINDPGHTHTGSADVTGGGVAHENRPPFFQTNYIIKL